MRIATYNLWNAPAFWATRLEAICEEVGGLHADVIALQEVPAQVAPTDVRDAATYLAKRTVYPHYVFQPYPDDPEEGLAFLSRSPLMSIECGWETGIPSLHNCGLRIRLTIRGTPIAITNVHLDWQSVLTREAQILGITEWIESRAEKGCHELLCGDFNSSPASSVYGFLTGQQSLNGRETKPWHDLALSYSSRTSQLPAPTLDFATNPRWATEPTLAVPARVDWLLLQDRYPEPSLTLKYASLFGKEPTPNTGVVPSDHYGVLADLT